MNNPFSRLKHYTVSGTDPQARAIEQQENHATECLAACLIFSSRIRKEFIRFVLDDAAKVSDSEEVDVATQETIEGGYIDLVLRQKGNLVMAVEVKVKSPENCTHHQNQLRNYKKWLDQQEEEPHHFLFTLVRNEDKSFHPEQYGATGRRTWWALYKSFKEMLGTNDSSDAESSLIENFCDYLEREAIVSTYETKDLLGYAEGVKARKAVTGIFNQIASRLEADGFGTNSIEDKKDRWPELRIQHSRWNKIFGKGNNEKISLWFCVPGIWEAHKHAFLPSIVLWDQLHGNDWRRARSKLSNWLAVLQSRNFVWDVYERWNSCRRNLAAGEIQSEPKSIVCEGEKDIVILNESLLQSEDDLINVLVNLIKQYANIVDSLGS